MRGSRLHGIQRHRLESKAQVGTKCCMNLDILELVVDTTPDQYQEEKEIGIKGALSVAAGISNFAADRLNCRRITPHRHRACGYTHRNKPCPASLADTCMVGISAPP